MSEERIRARPGRRFINRFRVLDEAAQRKLIKFTGSGLLIIFLGVILIFVGTSLHTGAYSAEGLLIGFGAIIVLAGILRVLIGFINPSSPTELGERPIEEYPQPRSPRPRSRVRTDYARPHSHTEQLQDEIFAHEDDVDQV